MTRITGQPPAFAAEMLAKLLENGLWSALFAAQSLAPVLDTAALQHELTVLVAASANLRRHLESAS
jgi:hypothetical protein